MMKNEKKMGGCELDEICETTTMAIPTRIKNECKKRGIPYKRCFLVGYQKLVGGETDQLKKNNKEISELVEGNSKLHRKLTELSLKVHDLEKKLGGENVEK